MTQSGKVGENPNDKMPPGVPLAHDELAPDFGEEQRRSEDKSGPIPDSAGETEDATGSDRENQSGSGGVNPGKFI